jgi:hypothetical protein
MGKKQSIDHQIWWLVKSPLNPQWLNHPIQSHLQIFTVNHPIIWAPRLSLWEPAGQSSAKVLNTAMMLLVPSAQKAKNLPFLMLW